MDKFQKHYATKEVKYKRLCVWINLYEILENTKLVTQSRSVFPVVAGCCGQDLMQAFQGKGTSLAVNYVSVCIITFTFTITKIYQTIYF